MWLIISSNALVTSAYHISWVENPAYLSEDDDSGDEYDISDEEIDAIIAQAERKESQKSGELRGYGPDLWSDGL